MGFFTRKTIQERIDKELIIARLRWEKDKKIEFDKFRNLWDEQKEKDITDNARKHMQELNKKDKVIDKLKQQITNQKNAFRKFKEIAIQNEILSTELSTEAEVFLQMTSKIAGTFAMLRYRAEKTTKQIERKEERDEVLKYINESDEFDFIDGENNSQQ